MGFISLCNLMQYYTPDFQVITTETTHSDASMYVMAITNNGNCNLILYSRYAKLLDNDYDDYNRDLQFVDTDTFTSISSITIAPRVCLFLFWVVGDNTWVDYKTTVYYEYKYDGVNYYAFTSNYTGTHY